VKESPRYSEKLRQDVQNILLPKEPLQVTERAPRADEGFEPHIQAMLDNIMSKPAFQRTAEEQLFLRMAEEGRLPRRRIGEEPPVVQGPGLPGDVPIIKGEPGAEGIVVAEEAPVRFRERVGAKEGEDAIQKRETEEVLQGVQKPRVPKEGEGGVSASKRDRGIREGGEEEEALIAPGPQKKSRKVSAKPTAGKMDRFCRQCGEEFGPDDRFCRYCGAPRRPL